MAATTIERAYRRRKRRRGGLVEIRNETSADREAIRALVYQAFRGHPEHEPGSEPVEHRIVDALRDAGALTLSLVAESNGQVIGHVAFSPVAIDGASVGWFGLGPVAVRPDRQRRGVGAALIEDGLIRLGDLRACGVVLVGEAHFYGRFGFRSDPNLTLPGVPAEYFLCLPLAHGIPKGVVAYHEAFAIG
jgi:putative acetyltransferase